MSTTRNIVVPKKDTTPRWLYECLRSLADAQLQNDRGLAAVTRGEAPDGSGTPLVDTSLFFYKPGIAGGQIAYGDTASGGSLTFSSTKNAAKGFIYLGDNVSTAFDEAHERLGITSLTPAAKLEIKQSGTTQNITPTSLGAGTNALWLGDDGSSGATRINRVNEIAPNDATYVQDQGNLGIIFQATIASTPIQPSTATIMIRARVRWFGTDAGAVGAKANMQLSDGNGTTIHNTGNITFATPHQNTDTGYLALLDFTLTPTEISNIANWNNMVIAIATAGGGTGYTGTFFISWIQLQIVGATAVDLIDLYSTSNALTAGFTSAAQFFYKTGAGAGNWFQSDASGNASWTPPGALTRVNDTNVTLTLGGNPTTALLFAASLTLGWTGTLAEPRGGTNQSTYATGDMLYASAANTLSKLAGNTTTTKQFLSSTGTGAAAQAPAWVTLANADLPTTISNKTIDDSNTITVKDGSFTVENTADTTKKFVFDLSGNTTGIKGTLATVFTTAKTVTLPDITGTLMSLSGTQSVLGAKTFLAAVTIDYNTNAGPAPNILGGVLSGPPPIFTFTDNTGGGSVLFQMPVAVAAALTISFPNASGTLLLQGGTVSQDNKTASITTTTILSPVNNHSYAVHVYVRCRTAGTAGSTVNVTIGWTSSGTAQTRVVTFQDNGTNSTTCDLGVANATAQGTVVVHTAPVIGNITYATTYSSAGGTPAYDLKIRVIDLG